MKIPLKYVLRSLWQRKTSTFLTIGSFVLVIFTLIALLAMAKGIEAVMISSGDPARLIIINKYANFEAQSKMTESDAAIIGTYSEIKLGSDAKPFTSWEVVAATFVESLDGRQVQVNVRGLDMPGALNVRDQMKLIAGKIYNGDSADEVILGKGIADGMGVKPGEFIIMKRSRWRVTGVFADNGSSTESEVWTSRKNVELAFKRNYLSSVWLKVKDPSKAEEFVNRLNDEKTISVQALTEQEYFSRDASTAQKLKVLTWFVAIIMSVGAVSSALNTMYASIADRVKELSTIRALGFQDRAVLQAIMLEALIQSGFAALAACVAAVCLNGITFKMQVSALGYIVFRISITPEIIVIGLVFSLVMGSVGGWLPARSAVRQNIVAALKG